MEDQKPETASTNGKAGENVKQTAGSVPPDQMPEMPEKSPVELLTEQLAEAKAEAAKNLDGWQRAAAEFVNYRKRVDKERAETYQIATVDTLKKILPVVDDFDRAIQSVPADQAKGLAYDGLKIIHRKLMGLLESAGITVINPQGEPFNAALHEAIGEDAGTNAASGTVTTVLQKGYVYGEKMLRPAMVRVAS